MVYIDDANIQYRRMQMSHMIADTLEELHDMADKIGVRRQWFQSGSRPHYDICKSKKGIALTFGAVQVTSRQLVRIIREIYV
jgi:hypothetical protein